MNREFPSNWKLLPIEDCMAAIIDYRGKSPRKASYGIPLITAKIVKDGRILPPEEYIPEDDYDDWTRRGIPEAGDILLTTEAPLGEVAQLDKRKVALAQRLITLRGKLGTLDNTFLKFALQSDFAQDQLRARGTGTTVHGIRQSELRKVELPIPPFEEQRAIASILGTLDQKIELNRRMNETLEAMARAIFKSWFVDFDPVRAKSEGRQPFGMDSETAALFPSSFEDSPLGKIPAGWTASTIGEHMVNLDSKRIPVSSRERLKRKGEFPYHGAAGVMDYVDDYLFDGIYLLVGEDGSVVSDEGLAVTQYAWGKLWVNNHAHVLQGRDPVSTEQLYLYFQFEPVTPYVTGAVQPKLSQGRMNLMPFIAAGSGPCNAFTNITKPFFDKLREGADENKTLKTLRDLLLPKLISGQIRIREAEKMVEERA